MRPLSFSDRYWFVKLTIGILALAAVVVIVLLSIKSCTEEPHTHTEGDNWIISKAASCTTEGVRYKVCTGCGEQLRYENIPAKGHKIVEKEQVTKNATCAVPGTKLVYEQCTACKVRFDEKTVEIPATGNHQFTKVTQINNVEPTCTVDGSYDNFKYCKTCPQDTRVEEIEHVVVPANGHDYSGSYTAVLHDGNICIKAVCSLECGEPRAEYIFGATDGVTVTRDESYANCCRGLYTVEMEYDDESISLTYDMEPEYLPPHTLYYDSQQGKYITAQSLATNGYYDYSNPIIKKYMSLPINEEWDENGFANGVYTCATCADANCEECHGGIQWVSVILYNPEYDTTK